MTTRSCSLLIAVLLGAALVMPASGDVAPATGNCRVVSGDVTAEKGEWTVKGRSAVVALGDDKATAYRIATEIQLAPKGGELVVQVMPADMQDLNKPAAMRVGISRDKDGHALRALTFHHVAEKKPWASDGDQVHYTFWPAEKKAAKVADLNLEPRTWHDRWLRLRIDAEPRTITVWLEGSLIRQIERPQGSQGAVAVQLSQGDRLRDVTVTALSGQSPYVPIDLAAEANDQFEKPVGKRQLDMGGVPFELPNGKQDHLSLRNAQWANWKKDLPWSHENAVPAMLHDPHMPLLRVPVADYVAAHVLAVADDDPKLAAAFTLRAGRYGRGGNEQDVQYDFYSPVPRRAQAKEIEPARVLQTPAGPLFHVRVPMDTAFAQDIDKFIEIELTKEVRLARRSPDPNRFRYRPLGLPSGVRIAALTLERSPLQMRVRSGETAHAFVEPAKPTFQVTLRNTTAAEQEYTLTLRATHLDGSSTDVQRTGRVEVNGTAELSIPVPTNKRGYHDLVVALEGASKRPLLRRHTSFALLPPDTRQHRDRSPFGTYEFGGAHYTSGNTDQMGPLYVKLGMRYGMFGASPEARRKYGVLKGNEPAMQGGLAAYEKALARDPDTPPIALLFHETSISGKHIDRVPDLFHDRPAYRLSEAEEKNFKKLWDQAVQSAKAMREKYPKVEIRFGNGPLPTKEEFFRQKFPAELFDSAGNESGSFGSLPEAQPPDYLTNNGSLWMDRQLLDAYGYKDKPVTMCHEVCYPCTNPGNLDPETQADYFVRHALHALAWSVPEFRPGVLCDVGGNYRMSHWGSSGFCRARPEFNVKPAFVAFATMTLVLDGAQFVRVLPLDSASLYGMEFKRPDGGQVVALWTIHGRRPVKLQVEDPATWKLVDSQANEVALRVDGKTLEMKVSSAPVYLVGKGPVTFAGAGKPEYDNKPAGKSAALAALSTLDDWSVEEGRNAELEFYNFMIPRRRGDFAFEPVAEFEGRSQVLRVTPRSIKHGKDTMPMYAVLAHKKGIPVPGTPTEIGAWVNGNSAWGRLMFELEDATGQRWISIGAQEPGAANPWVGNGIPDDLLAKFPNPGVNAWSTDDSYGFRRINFDGWRHLAFPLPGNYPGERYAWPANSQWRWDKDGIVHYPLTFKKLIVELPEKTLHAKTFAPVSRPEIYLKDLSVSQGDIVRLKTTADEYPSVRNHAQQAKGDGK